LEKQGVKKWIPAFAGMTASQELIRPANDTSYQALRALDNSRGHCLGWKLFSFRRLP
jgi:hypothetical protein